MGSMKKSILLFDIVCKNALKDPVWRIVGSII